MFLMNENFNQQLRIMSGDFEMEAEQEIDLSMLYSPPTNPVVAKWLKLFSEGKLTSSDFRDHWRVWVPKAYTPEHSLNCVFQWASKYEEAAQEHLTNTLEEFICNGDKDAVFKCLKQSDNPPAVCGKVFKTGETTYHCSECGIDITCVLCVDCFKQSIHKNHRYKMWTSVGGGCCDCGDLEAWKNGPCCDKHKAGLKQTGKVLSKFPKDLVERTDLVFMCVLKYAYQVLTLEYSLGLPTDLRIKDNDAESPICHFEADQYCTVLYNDETHTFEQVITTLAHVIKCAQKDAIDLATNIDREGRNVVKSSTLQHCSELKSEIERFTLRHGTKPLKVLVVHALVIAHQMFALKLLRWLQKLSSYAGGFRNIFTSVILKHTAFGPAMIEGILHKDALLWKSARRHWHRLFTAAMFMEYENKKAFAKYFTRLYSTIMKDFIKDDHDYYFSTASLSIQIFTVPTVAHHLIAHEDVLQILLNAFISECSIKCNKLGKLEFDRAAPNGPFKRTTYILCDLRYLLGVLPEVWTDELRKGFLRGVPKILTILTYMQGMGSVTRQVGQHMEYEPEWEYAFNLYFKLAPVITLMLRWCATDKMVLIMAYKLTLTKLFDNSIYYKHQGEVKELADHSASCVQYDVSTQPVSIHLPLSRFLAGLHLHLEKFGLRFDSHEFSYITKQTPEQILEPVLRTQVMIAQVHAGMWRRNGYSLANQIYLYHNVKCRGEMLDKDIILLQVCASLIESNEFLIHLLNKFALIDWAQQDFDKSNSNGAEDESIKQTINLVEEFLSLLIFIIGERYVPGVGKVTHDDCIKNKIIHQLCIHPLSHSEVNKALLDNINQETSIEKVVNEVAVFKKPKQASGNGVYEIKQEYLDKYNVFFYHYTKEELSKSEEEQRKVCKNISGLECSPPPVLPPLCESFSMVANLLQCDVMLYLMKTILERSLDLSSKSFSEAQLQKVLHLIGYALHEEQQNHNSFFTFTKRAANWGLEWMLEELWASSRIEIHKHLVKWTLTKFKQVTQPTIVRNMDIVGDSREMKVTEQQEKELRAKLAAERRAAIMAQMTALQHSFMKEHADMFEKPSIKSEEKPIIEMDVEATAADLPIALGPHQTAKRDGERVVTCILCQEEQLITAGGPVMVLAAFVQTSTVLFQSRSSTVNLWPYDQDSQELYLTSNMGPAPHTSTCGHVMHSACWKQYIQTIHSKENRRPYRLTHPTSFDIEKNEYLCPLCECLNNTVLPIIPSLHTLENGSLKEHIYKYTFSNWYEASLTAIMHQKVTPTKQTTTHTESGGDASTVTSTGSRSPKRNPPTGNTSTHVVEIVELSSELSNSSEATQNSESTVNLQTVVPFAQSDVYKHLSVLLSCYENPEEESDVGDSCGLSEDLLEMINTFAHLNHTKGFDGDPHEHNYATPMLAWKSCAYTVHSIEWLLRYTNKSLLGDFTCRQRDGLENLIRLSGVIGTSWNQRKAINSHAVTLLSLIIDNTSQDASVLDWDCFGLLVPLTASFPSLFHTDPIPLPSGCSLQLHLFYLMFLANVAQSLITCSSDSISEEGEADIILDETKCLKEMLVLVRDTDAVNTNKIWDVIKESSLAYLRCCTIYFYFLMGVPSPPALKEVGGDTFENMCKYLGIPYTCTELFDHKHVLSLFRFWALHPRITSIRHHSKMIMDMAPFNELIRLPDDYSELINTVSLFTCPNSDREDSRNPTMCLICGEMLCSQTYCCQSELNNVMVGACTFHAHTCGGGAGIFLRVRECEVLLLATPNRGCFRAPPYIDDYGETDQGLRRGNPLHLCEDSYRKLQLIWLSHRVHEEIARAIEFADIPMQWQQL